MKKILAIALALVMVLSMASAFASECSGPFTWTDKAVSHCGRAKVEIVPYVRTNAVCSDNGWVADTCAAAIHGERVYFAVKLTVEPNVEPEWLEKAELSFKVKGLVDNKAWPKGEKTGFFIENKDNCGVKVGDNGINKDAGKEKVYYLNGYDAAEKKWNFIAADSADFDIENVLFWGNVDKGSCVNICAKLESEYGWNDNGWNYVKAGKYTLAVGLTGGKVTEIWVLDADQTVNYASITIVDGKVTGIKEEAGIGCNSLTDIIAFLGLPVGTKGVTKDNVKANFGFSTEQEHCFKWSDKGAAIVNPQCEVLIPKTGDVSVIAYAVMALVAAAGAMGLKK